VSGMTTGSEELEPPHAASTAEKRTAARVTFVERCMNP
jgi:hypothetical protein